MAKKFVLVVVSLLLCHTLFLGSVRAYFNSMNASLVIQPTGPQTFSNPSHVSTDGTKLFVTDTGHNRVFVYNAIPSDRNKGPDVVIGQPNVNTTSLQPPSCGFNFLNTSDLSEGSAMSDGTHLFIADTNNNRILIYNSVPKKSGVCPDLVLGQSDLTATDAAVAQDGFSGPTRAFASQGKLFIVDQLNSRLLIYNSIPTANGAAANIVVGNTTFDDDSVGTTSARLNNPHGAATDGTHLVVADTENHRVLIWNTIPTTNGKAADIVLGQPNFTSNLTNSPDGNTPTSSNLGYPESVFSDGKRLYVSDAQNERVLIWNSFPTQNNQPADTEIGQDDMGSNFINSGGLADNTLNDPAEVWASGNQLFVADRLNGRILIFTNVPNQPIIENDNVVLNGANGLSRMRGNAFANDDNYLIQNVIYAVNGGAFSNATPTDGDFNENTEGYRFDFDPKANGNTNDGFTVQVNAINSNSDVSDRLFYFQPFQPVSPTNSVYIEDTLPSFEFSVNKQMDTMRKNVDSYQVQVRQLGGDWQTYFANIPVDFFTARDQLDKIKAEPTNGDTSSNNGLYETKNMEVQYTDGSSHIKVHAKDVTHTDFFAGGMELSGALQWKISATDQSGHMQETGIQNLRILSDSFIDGSEEFPLALLSISGTQKVSLSTSSNNPEKEVHDYTTKVVAPTFYGIANVSSKVSLELKEDGCDPTKNTNCTQVLSTVTNAASRFGINIPAGALKHKKKYSLHLFVEKDNYFNQLPKFTLKIK